MSTSSNPFCRSHNKRQGIESFIRGVFLIATYTIVIAALAIFGKIIIEGAPVIYKQGLHFLTSKPQTLFVMQMEKSNALEIPAENFNGLLATNHHSSQWIKNVTHFDKDTSYVTFDLLAGSRIGSGFLSELENQNKDLYVKFNERDKQSKVGFTVAEEKKITLKQAEFEALKQFAPELIPADTKAREVTLPDYKLKIAKGEHKISKDVHDALVQTPLIYQLRQTFSDDQPNQMADAVIPHEQTITVSSTVYYEAFDKEIRGALPAASEEEIPVTVSFYDITIKPGTYQVAPAALAALATGGISHLHNIEKGAVVLPEDYKNIRTDATFLKALQNENPLIKIANTATKAGREAYVRFDIAKDTEIQLGTEDRQALVTANTGTDRIKIDSEKTHSYSGGGVLGPIVGTALLVLICMLVALFTGIAASVFLNEYAKGGNIVKTIRLAMLNLAGVPSIVFGLFGLGLFVVAAPCVTSTPVASSKLIIPLVKIASKPDLREIEEKQILVAAEDASINQLVKQASVEKATRIYNGWTYLSLQGWGTSMLAGGFTLAMMVLPVIITSCEESLRAVPMGFREAALALGASKWQSIRTAVLPYAFPGILTASVLGITRVAGETAPIMFTAAVAEKSGIPGEGLKETGFDGFIAFLQESVQALPYHIFTVSGRIPQSEYVEPMQYGSVLVFMLIVMSFAGLSIWMRVHVRKKLKW